MGAKGNSNHFLCSEMTEGGAFGKNLYKTKPLSNTSTTKVPFFIIASSDVKETTRVTRLEKKIVVAHPFESLPILSVFASLFYYFFDVFLP